MFFPMSSIKPAVFFPQCFFVLADGRSFVHFFVSLSLGPCGRRQKFSTGSEMLTYSIWGLVKGIQSSSDNAVPISFWVSSVSFH